MNFEEWLNRPVYVVQCRTWKIAASLNLCSLGIRAIPGQRDQFAQLARDMVALSVRMDRLKKRLERD